MRSIPPRFASLDADRRPSEAVEEALSWASVAAQTGDFDRALAWIDTVEYVQGGLSAEWDERRAQWARAASEPARAVSRAASERALRRRTADGPGA